MTTASMTLARLKTLLPFFSVGGTLASAFIGGMMALGNYWFIIGLGILAVVDYMISRAWLAAIETSYDIQLRMISPVVFPNDRQTK